MIDNAIDVDLGIEVKGHSVIAHLLFTNTSSEVVHLDTWAIFKDDRISNDYFHIVGEGGNRIGYTGMLVKRLFNTADFIEFRPGDKAEAIIDIHSVYKLAKGNKYRVNYFAYHPSSLEDDEIIELESNKVEFQY